MELKEKQSIKDIALDHLISRSEDIADIMQRQQSEDPDIADQAYNEFYEYGLSFEYVPPFKFPDQRAGFWCWQISWGGPSEEFRVYVDEDERIVEIDFVYLNWGEGHTIPIITNPMSYNNIKIDGINETSIFDAISQLMEGR